MAKWVLTDAIVAETSWQHDLYGACYYSRHGGAICGDAEGPAEPAEQLPAWERHGSVMTGREW